MYSFVSGTVEEIYENCVVINNNGIGYEIFCSTDTLSNLKISENAKIYTYLHVREDAFMLFGFSSLKEKQMFLNLITVSGVGAKTAIAILSSCSLEMLTNSIISNDASMIAKCKGIGKKTAERILLELRGKVSDDTLIINSASTNPSTSAMDESIELLTNMGLTKMEAFTLVQKVASPNDTTEQIVSKALKNM